MNPRQQSNLITLVQTTQSLIFLSLLARMPNTLFIPIVFRQVNVQKCICPGVSEIEFERSQSSGMELVLDSSSSLIIEPKRNPLCVRETEIQTNDGRLLLGPRKIESLIASLVTRNVSDINPSLDFVFNPVLVLALGKIFGRTYEHQ